MRVELAQDGKGIRTLAKTDPNFRNSLLIVAGVSALLLIGGFGTSRAGIFYIITESIPQCTYTTGYIIGPGYYAPPGYYCSNVWSQRIVNTMICVMLIFVGGGTFACQAWAA